MTPPWVTQQARQLGRQIQDGTLPARYLIHDRDAQFPLAFDAVFASEGVEVIHTPYRAPSANAYAGHWVRSARAECLDHLLIAGEARLRRVLAEYIAFHNQARARSLHPCGTGRSAAAIGTMACGTTTTGRQPESLRSCRMPFPHSTGSDCPTMIRSSSPRCAIDIQVRGLVDVVGMGLIGNRHAWAYERHPQVDIVAVCDSDPARAEQGAARFACQGYLAHAQIAERDDIDLVSICTPDPFHVEPIMAMLQSGKHVLAEKPLTLSYAEAKLLVDEATRRNRILSVRLPQRHVADHRRIRSTIASGRLGDLVAGSVRSLIPITMPLSLSWASLTDLHWLYHQHRYDLIRWLTGLEAVDVFARGQRRVLVERGIDCYDSVQVTVTYSNGATVVYDTSWINPAAWRRGAIGLDLLCTNGRVATATEPSTNIVLLDQHSHNGAGPGIVADALGASGELPENQWRPVQEVADAILRDEDPPISAADALAVMAILEATDRSLRSGDLVAIRDIVGAATIAR